MLKRYPKTRRLYDTELSCHVSFAQIRSRLLRGEKVWEAGTGKDVTALLLARMITEEIETSVSAPTAESLREFILSYSAGKPTQKVA